MADPIASSTRHQLVAAFIAGLFLMTGLLVQAQEKSLADIARETKAKKAAAKAKVYDDDSLPKSSAAGGASAPAESAKAGAKSTTMAADSATPPPASNGNTPDELRAAIYAQKKRVADLEDEVNRLERDNRTLVAQDDADRNRRPTTCGAGTFCMETGETAGKRKDYDKLHDAKQAELAAARKKLDDLQQEARKAR